MKQEVVTPSSELKPYRKPQIQYQIHTEKLEYSTVDPAGRGRIGTIRDETGDCDTDDVNPLPD